jgi:tetratricopeptide (TPR) repeat protein
MKNLKQEERDGIIIIKPKQSSAEAEGELVVKPFSEQALYPAKIRQKEMKEEQEARELTLKAHNLEQQGNLKEALKLYEDAFLRFRTNIELAKKVAYLHYRLGHYAKSYFFSKEAMKINTQDPEAALYAALSAVQLKRQEEAQIFFEAATNSKPHLPEAFYNYGLFLEEIGKFSNALYQFQRYEQIFGPSLDVGLAIARIYEEEGKASDACKKYRELSFSGFSTDRSTEDMIRFKIRSLCGQGG